MRERSPLLFRVEWEPPGGVRAPDLRATWSRLEIWVDGQCASLVEESDTGISRRSIFVPLYPLAEWAAFNWWFLRFHSRPASAPTTEWTYDKLSRDLRYEWMRHHNVRGAAEGFPWPDLTIVPEEEETRIVWKKSAAHSSGGLRYLSSGETAAPSAAVAACLEGLISGVLTRLDEAGVHDTALHREWRAVVDLDEDERAFCEAAARIGRDPFSVEAEISSALERAGERLSGTLAQDFLNVIDARAIDRTLQWIADAEQVAESLTAPGDLDEGGLRTQVRSFSQTIAAAEPWSVGYAQARHVREILGVRSSEQFPVERFVSQGVQRESTGGLDAFGLAAAGVRLCTNRELRVENLRFSCGRALWHGLVEPTGPFVLTRARTYRQKIERAFAAELLAPAKGITDLLEDTAYPPDPQDVESVAEHFGVSPVVVDHQIENARLL